MNYHQYGDAQHLWFGYNSEWHCRCVYIFWFLMFKWIQCVYSTGENM